MASPNLSNVNSLYSLVVTDVLTTTQRSILVNPSTSNASYRISSIVVSNGNTIPSNVFVWHSISGSTFYHNLVGDRSIVAGNVNRIVSRSDRVVLDEGDSIIANTDSNVSAVINIFYEDASEFNRISADFLIVGGGGGGGWDRGSGGGAGGLIFDTGYLYLCCHSVIVGGGGTGGTSSAGTTGSNSSFSSFISLGGAGGVQGGGGTGTTGYAGGSGSGGSGGLALGVNGVAISFYKNRGNPGGTGLGSAPYSSGGGGGAGEPGFPGSSGSGGGNGLLISISGYPSFYAGGGGGSSDFAPTRRPGGSGGGGPSGQQASSGLAANVNTGGGGGGGGNQPAAGTTGGPGGSGIVILRYLGPARFNGGNITNVGGYTIHTFYNSGNLSLL